MADDATLAKIRTLLLSARATLDKAFEQCTDEWVLGCHVEGIAELVQERIEYIDRCLGCKQDQITLN